MYYVLRDAQHRFQRAVHLAPPRTKTTFEVLQIEFGEKKNPPLKQLPVIQPTKREILLNVLHKSYLSTHSITDQD